MSRLLRAMREHARMVLVVGDAGVGKTRFTGEAIKAAAATGMVMARGECLPLAATLPLLPIATAVGELRRLADGALLSAALDTAPAFVRSEVERLGLGGDPGLGERGAGRRERLFSALAALLETIARESAVGLVIEDVHWADSATLDFLTMLGLAGGRTSVTVVVTCRGDEAPLAAHVAHWLARVRGAAGVQEIGLGPMSRADVAEQVCALAGGPVLPWVVDELYARAEGNPFFTEQLALAALPQEGAEFRVPAGLPSRLAEVLTARAGHCGSEARQVLAALSVAARPLTEDLLCAVTGLSVQVLRRGLRELAAARLLAGETERGAHRPRHALLAEAVAGELLPGERAMLHAGTARALQATGDQTLAAEAAGHWQAAAQPPEELRARVAAAESAERVFGYSEAAVHWQRAIDLGLAMPAAASSAGIDVARLYRRAIDALYQCGDTVRSGELAEDACRRFAHHPDSATVAVLYHFAARYWADADLAAGLPLIKEAVRLFEQTPPSADHARDHARAAFDYAVWFLYYGGQHQSGLAALSRAEKIAEEGYPAQIPIILAVRASDAFLRGQGDEGFALLRRARALAQASGDSPVLVFLDRHESGELVNLGRFRGAADVAIEGLKAAKDAGLERYFVAMSVAYNACAALVALGRTFEAAAVIDPLSSGMDPDTAVLHEARAEIDLLRGDIAAAEERLRQNPLRGRGNVESVRLAAQQSADVALWAGRPADALIEIERALDRYTAPEGTIFCGRLLAAGMRACADLAEQAAARRDDHAAAVAVAAAERLASYLERMGRAPFTDHPLVATIPAERASWDAERTRLAGQSDPADWADAAKAWHDLGCTHRAGYALWRQAQALLDAGQPTGAAATALRAAAVAADGHEPLLRQIRALADRARIRLRPDSPAADAGSTSNNRVPPPYGLTSREVAVLRLLAAGRSNAQIGAELYISPSTAGVHVSAILRKLGVPGRVQAAALAERAGLLDDGLRQTPASI